MRVRFRADRRGVSEVVGAVLLLGILVLALSIYQVSVVPNQNAAVEFDHNQQVEDEIVDVRNAILEARTTGKDTFASVTLGTRYQDRTLAVNPPPPTGTIETVEQRNVSVVERGGDTDPLGLDELQLENQFLEYTPRYYEYQQAGTIRFENTVAYHEYENSNVLLTEQTLLRGETVSLVPLEGEFRKNGQGRVTIEPIPGLLKTVRVDDPNVTVPTELPREDWEELLDEELDDGETISVSDGNLTLALNGSYDVAYAPIGVNRPPAEGQRSAENNEINPAAPGDVQLVGADWSGRTVELTFRNSADNTTFTDGRINFYTGPGGTPDQADFVNATDGTDNPRGTNWVIGDDFGELDPSIELEGEGSETKVDVVFDDSVNENNDFFIITLTLESGQQATYFVGGNFSFDGSGGGGGDGGSSDAAANIEYNNDAGPFNGDNTLRFSISNTGDEATIESISVDTDDPDASVLTESSGGTGAFQNEIYISTQNSGWYDSGDGNGASNAYTLGTTVDLDNTATIGASGTAEFSLSFFQTSGGVGASAANVRNDQFTVILSFSDGSQRTLSFQNS